MKAYEKAKAHLDEAINILQFLSEHASEEERIEVGLIVFEARKRLQKVVDNVKEDFKETATLYPVIIDGDDRAQMVCTPQGLRRVVKEVTLALDVARVEPDQWVRQLQKDYPELFLPNGDFTLNLPPDLPLEVHHDVMRNTDIIKSKKNRITFREQS